MKAIYCGNPVVRSHLLVFATHLHNLMVAGSYFTLSLCSLGDAEDLPELANVANICFSRFLAQLPGQFPTTLRSDLCVGLRDRTSLIQRLGHGLQRVLAHSALAGKSNMAASQVCVINLLV